MDPREQRKAGLDEWQAAVKKRDELQDLLRGLDSLVKDGSIKLSSVEEVRKLLLDAQSQVDQLRARSVAH